MRAVNLLPREAPKARRRANPVVLAASGGAAPVSGARALGVVSGWEEARVGKEGGSRWGADL